MLAYRNKMKPLHPIQLTFPLLGPLFVAVGVWFGLMFGFAEAMNRDALQIALYVELAVPLFVFAPRRDKALGMLGATVAGWLATSAMLMLLQYTDARDVVWQSRDQSLAWWLACGGLLALGARVSKFAARNVRMVLVVCASLPVLWHYFGLEYSGTSLLDLRALSVFWQRASGVSEIWLFVVVGVIAWVGAFVPLPKRKTVDAEPKSEEPA